MSLRGIALTTALLMALAGIGLAQERDDRDRDDRGIYAPSQVEGQQAFQNGLRDGVNDGIADRQSNHSFRASEQEKYEDATSGYASSWGDKDVYKRFYRQGYLEGYQRGFNGTATAPVYGQAAPPVYTYDRQASPGQQAYANGYQDGLRDGSADMQSGHSFRPVDSDRYKHADAGYATSMGDKDRYKQIYRQGYAAGYQRGFNGTVTGTAAGAAYPSAVPAAPVYGQPAYGNQNQAYQSGFQDGVNDGASDKNEGHGFRPQKREHYEHADTGYNSAFGDKDQYKQAYRDGYMAGYRRGYGK